MTRLLIACGLLYFALPTIAFAACSNATPCVWTLYAKPSTSDLHLVYGDKLVIKKFTNRTALFPDAANWESAPVAGITLQSTVIFDPAGDPLDPQKGWIVPAWKFSFKTKNAHVPTDKDHLKAHLYMDPSNNEWKITAEHSDGSTHGGSAHMTN